MGPHRLPILQPIIPRPLSHPPTTHMAVATITIPTDTRSGTTARDMGTDTRNTADTALAHMEGIVPGT